MLKRSPLPTTIAWNGKSGLHLERFIDQFAGHVTMQTHMGYILLEEIALLWLKHGDATVVLSMAMQRGVHPCLRHVSAKQFIEDVVWLFGAMKQAITNRGKTIIQQHEKSQDGMSAWRSFHTKCCCDGNAEVHLSQQQQVLL